MHTTIVTILSKPVAKRLERPFLVVAVVIVVFIVIFTNISSISNNSDSCSSSRQ